jgi:hypothetical protein
LIPLWHFLAVNIEHEKSEVRDVEFLGSFYGIFQTFWLEYQVFGPSYSQVMGQFMGCVTWVCACETCS